MPDLLYLHWTALMRAWAAYWRTVAHVAGDCGAPEGAWPEGVVPLDANRPGASWHRAASD